MQNIRIYLSVFFLFFLFDAYSQTIENFSEQDGLSSNYVECVASINKSLLGVCLGHQAFIFSFEICSFAELTSFSFFRKKKTKF